ncbi:hypothetical protein [Hungatella hathewayi]
MYSYFCIHTKNINDMWSTKIIEDYIENIEMFTKESVGTYKGIGFYCLLGLMKVNDWDSWSDRDYNNQETNYISIITSKDSNGNIPKQSKDIMKKLSEMLSENIFFDE